MIRAFSLLVLGAAMLFAVFAAERNISVSRQSGEVSPDGWKAVSPREEIRPQFAFDPSSGHHGAGALSIEADRRDGQTGWWMKSFPVLEGKYYRFQAFRRVKNIAAARRSARVIL